jgi:paired small multidrug resistance pump
MMDLQWYDWVGLVGTLMVLAAYFLLQAGRLHGNGMLYQLLNLFGATGVLASLYGKFNVSVMLLMTVWIVITVYGLTRTVKGAGAPRPPG